MSVHLENHLPLIVSRMAMRTDDAVQKAAADIEAHAKMRAPVDTGNLRDSIQHESTGLASARVDVGAEYAAFVEYGTAKAAAQPYVVPAVEAVRPGFYLAVLNATRGY